MQFKDLYNPLDGVCRLSRKNSDPSQSRNGPLRLDQTGVSKNLFNPLKRIIKWWAPFLFIFFLSACNHFQDEPDEPVLARVGDEVLTLSVALQSVPDILLQQDTLSAIQNYQTTWVEERILLKEASRIGLDSDPEVVRRIERSKSRHILDALNETLIARHYDELKVDREEASSYYQENRDRFTLDERYIRFRHMTTSSRTDADQARRSLLGGTSWNDVARQYSIDPERQIADSERFFPISLAATGVPQIQRFLNVIGRTEVSEIISHGGSFHFVQLMEDRPEGSNPELDWLVDQIGDWLFMEKSQRFISSWKRNLYLQADANNEIEITDVSDLDGLNFNKTSRGL